MDLILFFIKGLGVGLAIAVPLGPVGLLCLQRSLEHGRAVGFTSGLGAAAADTFYGAVAAFGLTWISDFLLDHEFWLGMVGGLVLVVLALKAFWASPADPRGGYANGNHAVGLNYLSAFLSTFAITITSPVTIVAFATVFTALGLVGAAGKGHGSNPGGMIPALLLVAGVFTGSTLWWLSLSILAGLFRKLLNLRFLIWANRLMGAGLLALALALIVRTIRTGGL